MRKTCVVDCRKWQRGGFFSSLLNNNGEMCCLGFFTLQFTDLKRKDILGRCTPKKARTDELIPHLTWREVSGKRNTLFSRTAMTINDDRTIDDHERMKLLRKLGREEGVPFRFTHQEVQP